MKTSACRKTYLLLILIFLILDNTISHAQQKAGIKFVHGLSWAQIKAKAKKERKYIFVDGYTTWCGPCKMMAQDIFPQQKVGDFFNQHFINVSVQFDVSKTDNAETRKWYKDAKYLENTYKVNSYPTFLYFNPDGELVHTISGGTTNPDEFISKSKAALDPKLQLISLKKQFDKGKRDTAFLSTYISAAQQANNDTLAIKGINAYLGTHPDMLAPKSIGFIVIATKTSTDPGFKTLLNNAKEVDAVAGKGKSAEILNDIVFEEEVLPFLRTDGKITRYPGGMITISGDVIKEVAWDKVKEKLEQKYPGISDQIIMAAKPSHYEWLADWPKYTEAVTAYIAKYGSSISDDKLSGYAWQVFSNTDDKQNLTTAAGWIKPAATDAGLNNLNSVYTYANLLYKAGQKEQAITYLQDVMSKSPEKGKNFSGLLTKIKNNEQTWQ
ncbi:hypothetical protein GCM10023149_36650 [Mucilaginibacter gynuensis]|uniref:Thioredoxin domain-containing protein n=1 Tax=Mucilaginibacter gynuensis TaxID=1302236 RepID=A0ABP8GWP6_9SPHI